MCRPVWQYNIKLCVCLNISLLTVSVTGNKSLKAGCWLLVMKRRWKGGRTREREGDRVREAGVLRLGDANKHSVAFTAYPVARTPSCRSFIIC